MRRNISRSLVVELLMMMSLLLLLLLLSELLLEEVLLMRGEVETRRDESGVCASRLTKFLVLTLEFRDLLSLQFDILKEIAMKVEVMSARLGTYREGELPNSPNVFDTLCQNDAFVGFRVRCRSLICSSHQTRT
jgi:hypothetical protein